MSALEESFEKLLGRQPTDKDRQALYRVRDALRLRDNDALWLLLMILGHYEATYEKFPQLIREAAESTLANVKQTAETQLKACAESTHRELVASVARVAADVARDTAKARAFRWMTASVVAVATTLVLVAAWAHRNGTASGYARGWAEAFRKGRDEKAAASWANTPEGQLAYGLAKAGSIRELAGCLGRGWVAKAGVCLPRPERGTLYGWRLAAPSESDR